MARRPRLAIREALCKLFSGKYLKERAKETGVVKRDRNVKIVDLFWTLVLGFGAGRTRTLAGLRREYEQRCGETLVASSFHKRFTLALTEFLHRAMEHGLESLMQQPCANRGILADFKEMICTDATVIKVHDLLASSYPATRKNSVKAAMKLHLVWCAKGAGRSTVKVTGERTPDLKKLVISDRFYGSLLLFDLGYFAYTLFSSIIRHQGFFVSRLKGRINPVIVADHGSGRGRSVDLVGQRLRDVEPLLKRKVVDLQVEVEHKRRAYRGKRSRETLSLRLIGLWNEDTACYQWYVTNISTDRLSAEEIGAVYRFRWQIELLFRELKGRYRLDQLPTSKDHIVKALFYASILTLIVSRRLLALVAAKLSQRQLPTERFADILVHCASEILSIMLAKPPEAHVRELQVTSMLLHEAIDPNRKRSSLLKSVEFGEYISPL